MIDRFDSLMQLSPEVLNPLKIENIVTNFIKSKNLLNLQVTTDVSQISKFSHNQQFENKN